MGRGGNLLYQSDFTDPEVTLSSRQLKQIKDSLSLTDPDMSVRTQTSIAANLLNNLPQPLSLETHRTVTSYLQPLLNSLTAVENRMIIKSSWRDDLLTIFHFASFTNQETLLKVSQAIFKTGNSLWKTRFFDNLDRDFFFSIRRLNLYYRLAK